MTKDVPTEEDFNAAHVYAMSKLCLDIPETFGEPGLTEWDDHDKVCRISRKGCQPEVNNPLTQPLYDSGGGYIEYEEDDPMFGEFWKKMPPGYYVWRTTKKSPRKEVCARGNFLMQQWCEAPKTRSEKEEPGITNVPPFEYKVVNGVEECHIPKAYCDSKGVSYDAENKDCFVSDSQKVAEFFSSTVMVRSGKASDKRLKNNITLIKKDFPVEGIHVYSFEWNEIAYTTYGYSGYDVGFIADELDEKYIKYDPHGFKMININYQDDTMKKIYAFLKIKDTVKNISV